MNEPKKEKPMNEPKADGGAAVPCISLLGDAWPHESGHVNVQGGCVSLSWGVCEQVRKLFPNQQKFTVQITITPNKRVTTEQAANEEATK